LRWAATNLFDTLLETAVMRMIVYLPDPFDKNEWFVTLTTLILLVAVIVLPRQFPKAISAAVMIFSAFLGITVDFILASDFPFDSYSTFDTTDLDLYDVITYTVTYSLYGYLFHYFYRRLRVKGMYRTVYILVCSGLSTLFEWLAVAMKVYTYIHWTFLYSFIAYLCIFTINLAFQHIILKNGARRLRRG
jgi:hypothetical protein